MRPDHWWIRGLAEDLIGLRGARVEHVPHTPGWTSGPVAARLAVLHAAQADPELLCGTHGRKPWSDLERIRDLLDEGIDAGERLDLRGPVAVPVRCRGEAHAVVLEVDGSFSAPAHPEIDVEAERVMLALGGSSRRCVEAVLASGPAAEPSGSRQELSAPELLSFVRLCRSWLTAGFNLARASEGLERGLACAEQGGLTVVESEEWRDASESGAQRWLALGFTAGDRRVWLDSGRSYEDAQAAAAVAGGAHRVMRWARVVRPTVPAEALGEWALWGDPVSVWAEIASLGLRPGDLPAWKPLLPVEVLAYLRAGATAAEARRWHKAGYGGFSATRMMQLGVTIEQGWLLRDHPVRRVQELWPMLGSVDLVLAQLNREAARPAE